MPLATFSCPACLANTAKPIFDAPGIALGLPHNFPIISCTSCGLIALWPQPSNEVLAAAYTAPYYTPHGRSLTAQLYEYIFQVWSRKRLSLLRNVRSHGAFLDVGCGAGQLVADMLRLGYDAYGMDVSPDISQVIPAVIKPRITIASLDKCHYKPGSFDLIMLSDVLEHVRRPELLLRQLHCLLKTDGRLVVSVPNWRDPEARVFGRRYWHNLDAPRHLWHFTFATLGQLTKQAEFEVVGLFRLGPVCLLEAPLSLVRGWQKYVNYHSASPLLHRLLSITGAPIWFLATPLWRLANYHKPRQLRILLKKKSN